MATGDQWAEKTALAQDEPPPPPSPPREGDIVGSYQLLKQLGSGGMGSVFLATHQSIGRKVAMKFLLPELSQYPDIVGRFFDEARSVNRINHENIVEVFDFVRSPEGLSYIVMELLEGTDLYQTRKRDGPYPLGRMLMLIEQVASALGSAHKVGIIHRDLKPENVFLIRRRNNPDFVKLLDFGLAKLSEDLPMARLPTQAGIVMGTPGYMSPEQAHGGAIDGRSDIFSLGILMHWMLADRVPERGPNSEAPQESIYGDPIPESLRALIATCIRGLPDERPGTMDEVLAKLTELRRAIRGTEVVHMVQIPAPVPEPNLAATVKVRTVSNPARREGAATEPELPAMPEPPPPLPAPRSQLLLGGVGGAIVALVLVGILYLIFGRRDPPPPDPKVLAAEPVKPAPTTNLAPLTAPPDVAPAPDDGDVALPKAKHKKKHHPAAKVMP